MAAYDKGQVVDMTLRNEDLNEADYGEALSIERLLSILASPNITDFKLKSDCASRILKTCSHKLQYEETLLSVLFTVQETFKEIAAKGFA